MDVISDYAEYRDYIDEFAKTIDPHDQLPLRVSGYCLREYEIHGEIIEWLLIYLGKSCPTTLRIYLIQTALKKILEKVRIAPEECGYDSNRDIYQPLKLVRVVVAAVNDLIFDLQDNAKLYEVPLPPTSPNASELTKLKEPPKISVDAIKNARRTMEDRHVIIEDFNGFFNTQDTEPTFYYGIFDGHSGSDAATYANSHLNYNISVHPSYPSDIKKAMNEAFLVTDLEFLKKAHVENLNSGTTALCAIYRKTQKKLFVGWCGDSQALISRLGNVHQIVRKHSPEDEQERKRIENLGGVVLYWSNSYRVNGSLAVSRAIGDAMHKPFVSAEPEISVLDLDGEEDFFVMGCDGLWDSLSEDDIAVTVYKRLKENPNNYRTIASDLCSLAKSQGSRDNISVIVVYLKEPELIATQSWPSEIAQNKDIMEDIFNPDQPKVSIDPLGNQDIMNNPFGDFMGKSTEITDLVLNQQHDNEFVNLTDRLTNNLNTINNNLLNNGSHDADENIIAIDNSQNFQPQQDILILNDDNNNSNDNFNTSDFGPETDVDAMEDNNSQATGDEAAGGEKEKSQMEFKETDDVVDRVKIMTSNVDLLGNEPQMFEKINEEISKDVIFSSDSQHQLDDNSHFLIESLQKIEEVIDNSKPDEFNYMQQDEAMTFESNAAQVEQHFENNQRNPFTDMDEQFSFNPHTMMTVESMQFAAEDNMICANEVNEEVAIQQAEQSKMTDLEIIGTAQAIEESDGSEDEEWNYIKVEDKKEAKTVDYKDNQLESPIVDEGKLVEEEEEEEKTAPIEVAQQLEENLTESDNNKNIEGEQEIIEEEDEVKKEDQTIDNECQLIESPVESIVTDNQLEKKAIEEERFVLDDIEKDLELQFETDQANNMDSPLNPDAKEFVPLLPVRNEFQSPPPSVKENGKSPYVNQILTGFSDSVVSQSPRKGEILVMEDVAVPEEKDFEKEADARAHEVNLLEQNFKQIETPEEELNLKEAMQTDDKLEQGYKDDSQGFFEEEKVQSGDEYKVLESSFDQYSNGFQNKIDDTMNRSFYEGRDNNILADPAKSVLNTTQPLMDDEEEATAVEQKQTNGTHEGVDFLGGSNEWVNEQVVHQVDIMQEKTVPFSQVESSDNFEAEKFVEEIKGLNENFNKYVDTELSPTVPIEISNVIQTVEETIIAAHSPMKTVEETNLEKLSEEITEAKQSIIEEFEHQETEIKDNIPEPVQQELIPTMEAPAHEVTTPIVEAFVEKIPEIEKLIENPEKVAAATAATLASIAAIGTAAAVLKKQPMVAKKTETKKVGDVKAKVPSKPAEVKKTEIKPKTATSTTKPSVTAAKAPVTKTIAATKPLATTAARPKTTTTIPPVKKAPLSAAAKPTEAKPPVSKTTTVPKRPITSAPISRPAAPKAAADVKPKVNGTTERKPLSAPATRAPPKPSTLTVKSKVNGASSATAAKSPSATKTTRLSTSVIEKTSPPANDKLNKSLSAATTSTKPPRTVTSATSRTTTLKSTSTAAKPLLSAVGTKKPLSTVTKKAPTIEKTSTITTVIKKPLGTTTKTSTTVKKTTTTTVVKKKVVNGDVVEESKKTTTTESAAALIPELNGHHMNGTAENGDVIEQEVIEPAAN